MCNSMALAGSFGNGQIADSDLAAGLQGAVVKEEEKDSLAWKEYLENVMKKRFPLVGALPRVQGIKPVRS